MGDGSFNKKDNILVLHTQGFDKENNELISKFFNKKFGLNTYLTRAKSNNGQTWYYLVNIPHRDKEFIINKIAPHILEEFKYKVNYKTF